MTIHCASGAVLEQRSAELGGEDARDTHAHIQQSVGVTWTDATKLKRSSA